MSMSKVTRRSFGFGLLALPALVRTATAQVSAIRLGKQYGLPFLPQMVMEAQQLIEKHAAAKGVSSLHVAWMTMAGPGALNEGLLSGSIEFINVAPPSLATLWEKTANSSRPARALCTVQSMPYVLVTRNPKVKTIADFTDADKIAVPTAKISGQAMILQIAAAKLWGFDQYERLDPLTISLGHPDALAAMLSSKLEVTAHFCVAPFHYYELAAPGMHVALKSYDVLGGPHTNGVQVTTLPFYRDNPRICEAVFAAHEEANAFIKQHPRDAAEIYISLSGDRRSAPDEIVKMITDPDIDYTTAPANVMALVDFMHKTHRLRTIPSSWKDMFLPTAHDLQGS
jgi:NitT/TauT family transport system substrate-binding protein